MEKSHFADLPVAVQRITEVLRKPEVILEAGQPQGVGSEAWGRAVTRLHDDIQVAFLCDPGNCPEADVTRREMGDPPPPLPSPVSLRDAILLVQVPPPPYGATSQMIKTNPGEGLGPRGGVALDPGLSFLQGCIASVHENKNKQGRP